MAGELGGEMVVLKAAWKADWMAETGSWMADLTDWMVAPLADEMVALMAA